MPATASIDSDAAFLHRTWWEAFPRSSNMGLSDWAAAHLVVKGSAISEQFAPDVTPWLVAPMDALTSGTVRHVTVVGPVQRGKSLIGEAWLGYLITSAPSGDIQINWEDDDKADERWDKRIAKILRATPATAAIMPARHKKGLVILPHLNITVQGAHSRTNLDSDAIRFQINEETHQWKAGHLALAHARVAAYWNSIVLDISNGSTKGDQTWEAFNAGTCRRWQWQCPSCGGWQDWRTRTFSDAPGGLRYDADAPGVRYPDGSYNYNELVKTLSLECEHCGVRHPDDPNLRKALDLNSRYSPPTNPGAPPSHESFTFESLASPTQSWLDLVREKHTALRALKYGDPEPFRAYVTRREGRFWDARDRPLANKVELTKGFKLDEGIPDRHLRTMGVDRQRGEQAKGDHPHFWVVVRDWKVTSEHTILSRLVFEGRIDTGIEVEQLRARLEVEPRFVMVDSGYDTSHVYELCWRYGWTAIKGVGRDYWTHDIGTKRHPHLVRRIYSPTEYTDPFAGKAGQDASSIALVLYSKQGIRDRLHHIRNAESFDWQVPEDVSRDYLAHMEAEELQEVEVGRTKESVMLWAKVSSGARNDLFVCECYCALCLDMTGLVEHLAALPPTERPAHVVDANP